MARLDDANDKFLVSNLIEDTVVSNTYPINIIFSFYLFCTHRTGIFLQIVYYRF